jgi:DNA (cytosine-5)-methyltransferase 1
LVGITLSGWRRKSIESLGNAIVPQIAFQIFRIIEHVDKQQRTKH